jgi:hypothetical protein
MAFPVASGLLADSLAFWLRGLAVSNAVRLLANSYALRAVKHLASLVRALDLTLWLLALDIADSVSWLGARCVTFGRLAYWITDGGTVGVVALP